MVPTSIKSVLCDIEGTTTSISFVKVGLPAVVGQATQQAAMPHVIFSLVPRLGVTATGVSFFHRVQNVNSILKYFCPLHYYNKFLKTNKFLLLSAYFWLKNAKQNV